MPFHTGRNPTGDQPMSSSHRAPIFWVGLDVHKDSVTAAVFRNRDPEPQRVDRLPYDLKKIRRYTRCQTNHRTDNRRWVGHAGVGHLVTYG
jgi:hypothetical protein